MMHVLRPYFLFLGLVFAVEGMAQLPDGSIAPDFTATDLDGVEHNLYDILDEGKPVIINFAATWSGPVWSYILNGALNELHEMYGPEGTDEIRVFFIESGNGTLEDLQGTGNATTGDWTAVVNFPIIDNGESIFDAYECNYWPTIFTVCPNRILTESGQIDAAGHTAIFQANSCQPDFNGACIDPIACNYWEESGAGTIVYSEGFEGFSAGDYIASSAPWTTWSGSGYGSDEDAQVSTEYAFEGVNSLNIYGSSIAGGPMDVLLPVGLNGGEYNASFWMYIPEGSSGYYNVQEDVSPGVGWAFDVSFTVSGEVQIVADEATVGTGIFPHDEWFQMYHNLDMDNNLATLSIDGVTLNSFPFDSPFGGINFWGFGDGATMGNYFVDEIAITLPGNGIIGACTYPGCQDALASNYDSSAGCSAECFYVDCTDPLACNYNPNAIEEDGSCEYSCPDCEANYDFQGVEWAYFPDPAEGEEFEDASVNAFYEDAFYIMVPTEASQIDPAFTLPLDSMVFLGASAIDVLTGAYFELDALGLSAVCNHSGVSANDCAFPSGTQNCVNFTGTPSVEGDFFISIELQAYVTVFGIPVAQPYVVTDIPLHISAQEFDGCIDPSACNFDPSAIEDDSSCTYPGCMDPLATNYDSSAGCSAECIYLTYDCGSIGQPGWADESIGLYPEWQDGMHGVAWEGEWVFNIPSIIEEPSSGVEYAVHHIDWTAVNGLPDWVDEAEFILGELGEGSQYCIQAAGTPTAPSMYDISAVGEVFISIFGQPFSIGIQTYTAVLEVVGNPNPILGCTYPLASNYMSFATTDDSSCIFPGCTDPEAGNYSAIANSDDGSCGEECDPNANSSCTSDNNGDGVVNVSDLLILLSEFGTTCE